MPKTTIQIASVNFAFSLPAKDRPTSQSIGAMTIMATDYLYQKSNNIHFFPLPNNFLVLTRLYILLKNDCLNPLF